jgi:hypothetical protein
MKHKEIINEIEKFVFLGSQLSENVIDHINKCSECEKYYENALKFSNGLAKLKSVSSKVSENINLDKDKFESYISERVIRFLSFRIFMNGFKKLLIGLSVVLLVFLSSFLGSFVFNSYWSSKNKELFSTSLIHDNQTSYQEETNYSSTYEAYEQPNGYYEDVSYYGFEDVYGFEEYFGYGSSYQEDYYTAY